MTGPDHYREAERLLDEFGQTVEVADTTEAAFITAVMHGAMARAQVHATLAVAAALGLFLPLDPANERMPADEDAWVKVAGEACTEQPAVNQ